MFRRITALALALMFAAPAMLLAATPVNINKADAITIANSLDGIGQSKAQAIVAWRETNGPFKSVDQLTQVKGIGGATIERNRTAIRFTGQASSGAGGHAHSKSGKETASR